MPRSAAALMPTIAVLTFIAAAPAGAAFADGPDYAVALDARMRSTFPAHEPGCVVSIMRDGQIEFVRGYGSAEVEHAEPLEADSRMAIASVSKQFTAMAILLLEQDGRLNLDAPVSGYIAGLPGWAATMTVSDLLHHSSGVRDYITLQDLRGVRLQDYYSAEELFDLLARQGGLDFEPGTRAAYSNSGYFLLGLIVERVTGDTLRAFMTARLFEPLGMHDTFLQDDWSEVFDRRAYGYSRSPQGRLVRDLSSLDIVGDGGVVTTARDLSLWDANFYDNRLGGGAALIARMEQTGQLRDGASTPHAAGLFVRTYRGQRRIGHTGNFGGFKAVLQRYPDLHASVALMCNSDAINAGAESVWITELVLGSELDPPPARSSSAPEPSGPVQAFQGRLKAGDYFSEDLDTIWRIEPDPVGGLSLRRPHQSPTPLIGAGRDRLATSEAWFEIVPTGEDTFNVVVEDAAPFLFRRVADDGS